MRKLNKMPKNVLVINKSTIVYENQDGETLLVGKVEDKSEMTSLVMDLQKLFTLPRSERIRVWRKLSVELG